MKKSFVIIAMIFILPLVAYSVLSLGSSSKSVAHDINNPTIIKFSSKLCMDCKRLEDVVKEVYPNYKTQLNYKEVRVDENTKEMTKMIKKYDVVLVPTLVYLDKDGNIIKKTEGFVEKSVFENNVKALINGTLR